MSLLSSALVVLLTENTQVESMFFFILDMFQLPALAQYFCLRLVLQIRKIDFCQVVLSN